MKHVIEEVWIDEEAEKEALTGQILSRLSGARTLRGEDAAAARQRLSLHPDPFKLGKRILRLRNNRGAFVKPCPGTREYVCCGLQILNVGQGCPMDCKYCALQAYFNRPVLELFVNVEDLFSELIRHLASNPGMFHRFCTGEFADSLALDHLTGLSRRLVEFFAARTDASLEIKTKTDSVTPLLDLDPGGRVVISFSVNSPAISASDELRAAPLSKRLAAAVRARDAGYLVGFHFDPITPLPGWAPGYFETVDRIFEHVNPQDVAWISMGVLRFVPDLKDVVRSRFGPVRYFHDSFLRGLDGKSRLPAPRRIEVYKSMAERIRKRAPDARIYLCMESPHVWRESLGIAMQSNEELAQYLNSAFP